MAFEKMMTALSRESTVHQGITDLALHSAATRASIQPTAHHPRAG